MVKEKTPVKKPVKKKVIAEKGVMIYDLNGEEKGSFVLPKILTGAKVNPQILSQYVRVYSINQRHGTASTKSRGEVVGSTRKIYKQKGTGRARHGDIKAPIFVGGGVVGGPTPKVYEKSMNRKMKKLALIYSLALKWQENNLLGLAADSFSKMKPKTKPMADFLKKINKSNEKTLLVFSSENNNLVLSARNLDRLTLVSCDTVNPFQILNHRKVLLTENALKVLSERLQNES
jgi:large subunit ribosomal protein L4